MFLSVRDVLISFVIIIIMIMVIIIINTIIISYFSLGCHLGPLAYMNSAALFGLV